MVKKYEKEPPIIETKYASIYPADIERIEYNYINKLPNENDIYNVNTFIGLLFELQKEVIKPALMKPTDKEPGLKGYNMQDLDSIFYNIFIPLIAKYRITPTIGLFSFISGVTVNTMKKWKYNSIDNDNDIYINNNMDNDIDCSSNDRINNNINRLSYYTKWNSYIEGWILSHTLNTSSVGGMFTLKAVYGYSDQSPVRVEVSQIAPKISEKQLETITGDAAQMPQIETD